MKNVMFTSALFLLISLSGCTTAQIANDLANRYCDADPERKMILGYEINKVVEPHKLRMECSDE